MKLSYSIWTENVPQKSHRLSNKNPNARHEKTCFELVSKSFKRLSKQNKLFPFSILFLCIPEVEGKSLLLNTPHASDIGLIVLYLNVSSLQYSSHSNRTFNASCEKRSNQYSYPALMPMNYINEQQGKINPKIKMMAQIACE